MSPPLNQSTGHESLDKSLQAGRLWLVEQIADDGRIGGQPDEASLYYKVPASLVLCGDLGGALKVLNRVRSRFLDRDGRLAVPAEQEARRKLNTYDRGWLAWGASLCGRYEIAFPLAEDFVAHQDGERGGFWDSAAARTAGSGPQHAMTAGMAGLALLATRHVAEAQSAARFLLRLLDVQPEPEEGFYFVVERTAGGGERLALNRTSSDYLDRNGLQQRPARLGPVIVLLVRLFRLTNEFRYLDGARRYADLVLTGRQGIDECVESHKFLWALVELDEVAPDPRYREAAARIRDYIVRHQQPEGDWRGEAVGGGADQPLDLRLNTTCNALVGLAYCLAAS